jgi:copper chaperone
VSETVKLSIEGMHCDACVRRVNNALTAVPGVEVKDVAVGSATVAFDENTRAEAAVAAVESIGFPARLAG